jgi:hypothetical protein
MPDRETMSIRASGITLPEARTGQRYELGELSGVWVLTAIRHRHY